MVHKNLPLQDKHNPEKFSSYFLCYLWINTAVLLEKKLSQKHGDGHILASVAGCDLLSARRKGYSPFPFSSLPTQDLRMCYPLAWKVLTAPGLPPVHSLSLNVSSSYPPPNPLC